LGVLKFARFKILKISARNSKRSRSRIIDYDAFGMTAISLGAVPCLSGQSMVIVTFGQNRSLPARQRGLVRSESTKPAYANNVPYPYALSRPTDSRHTANDDRCLRERPLCRKAPTQKSAGIRKVPGLRLFSRIHFSP
jgi:hypothetical protein